ncbi:LacI family DNA-binding transcriptional regulator [Paenibacillus antibioticophila]|uniref:LacI family DNA-binding transcriptional regulator n=1 Tax=Paenibacillus antibioticophila TaxID=1274374 RepID=UPI0005C9AFCC|nr:LacI family DNA-binding transcriptional regulator [Paenibacillus antibioticophila]
MNIKTIAELAGVSVSTVSKILNNYSDISDETKSRVLQIIRDTGYVPTKSAKLQERSSSGLIGVIFAGRQNIDFSHPFFAEVLSSFKRQIGFLGYDLLFLTNESPDSSHGDYLTRCRQYQIDGCLIISGQDVEPAIDELDRSEIACMGIDLELLGKRSGYIMSDNYKMSYKAVEHFYLLGYREFGYIGSTMESKISNLREKGYTDALEGFGLNVNKSWFVNGDSFYEESGYQAMKAMIKAGSVPQALFAASDLLAIGAMQALKEHHYQIPHDVAIMGCDDIEACKYTSPSLSTVRQNKDKIGKLAAALLYDFIHTEAETGSIIVEPEIVIRESCGG